MTSVETSDQQYWIEDFHHVPQVPHFLKESLQKLSVISNTVVSSSVVLPPNTPHSGLPPPHW